MMNETLAGFAGVFAAMLEGMSYVGSLMAQAAPGGAAPALTPTTGPTPQVPWFVEFIRSTGILLPAVAFLFVFYVIVIRGKKKQERERQAQLDSIKKGDHIETIGGLIGTVVNTDGKTIVLKVDENANVKLRFNRRAIHRVVTDEAEPKT